VVTLEPCSHIGRTAPCTDVIRSAGIARVVYANPDPHDVAAGGGAELGRLGLDVESGVLADATQAGLGPWLSGVSGHRPYVTWKYAATLDGRTAAADGTSQWITGDAARRDVHRERFAADAVIAGVGTVLADDPQLTVRDWPASRQPLRVVVDSDARTPVDARVLDAAAPTAVAVAADANSDRVNALRDAGADVISTPRLDGRVDLVALLSELRARETYIALLEGGATLAASFLRAGVVDRVIGYHAPLLLGAGAPILPDIGVTTLAGARRLALDEVVAIGDDVRIVARVAAGSS
jgi:diaminohydroxyphosphoribosylaminopyrimidine deaminase/5-amino-6-(5-phosphoribosylamino)uracil reductase